MAPLGSKPQWGPHEIFSMGDPAPCDDACDINDDGKKDISEPIYGLAAQFSGGPPPPPPHPACGSDPSTDTLDCETYSGCP